MTILLAIAILALVGLVVYRDLLWEQRCTKLELERSEERQAAAAERMALLAAHEEERAFHAQERKELYQRIQAPEVAVAEAVREARGPREPRKPRGHDHDIHASEVKDG